MAGTTDQIRFRWLVRLFFALLIGVCVFLFYDAGLREALSLPNFTPHTPTLNDLLRPEEQEKRDPELGGLLATNAVSKELRSAVRPGKSGYLLVFVGDCTGCLKVDFPFWAKKARESNVQMVGLTQAPRERIVELQSQLKALNVQMPIISDPRVELVGVINSYYAGRAYLFSPNWRLEWFAHSLSSESSFWDNPSFIHALREARQQ